jgi:hypothetical protein
VIKKLLEVLKTSVEESRTLGWNQASKIATKGVQLQM